VESCLEGAATCELRTRPIAECNPRARNCEFRVPVCKASAPAQPANATAIKPASEQLIRNDEFISWSIAPIFAISSSGAAPRADSVEKSPFDLGADFFVADCTLALWAAISKRAAAASVRHQSAPARILHPYPYSSWRDCLCVALCGPGRSHVDLEHGIFYREPIGQKAPDTGPHTAAIWLMQRGVPIWEAAGFLGMSPEVLQDTYGHHYPDHLHRAATAIGQKGRYVSAAEPAST
jgi:hypothetical protein